MEPDKGTDFPSNAVLCQFQASNYYLPPAPPHHGLLGRQRRQANPDVSALHQYEYEIYLRRSPSGWSVGSSVLPAPFMCNVGKTLKTLELLVFLMSVAILRTSRCQANHVTVCVSIECLPGR